MAKRARPPAPGDESASRGKPKARTTSRRKRATSEASPALPSEGFDAPLHELERDALSVFLYVALMPEETVQLVRELNLSQPGFRQESLGDVQRCDLLADEIRAVPERRAAVMEMLRKGWERPALATWPLAPEPAMDLLDASSGDGALPLALWRVLCDPAAETRAQALPFLERLAEYYYRSEGGERPTPAGDPGESLRREREDLARKLAEAQQALARAEERTGSARKKGEEAREKLQSWLKEARAREAQALEDAARARESAEAAQRERARAETELAAIKAQDAAVEAQRLRGALRDVEARANALALRLERAQERERELAAELSRVRSAAQANVEPVLAPFAPPGAESEPEEAPASWLMPVYTREFYDSLEGWDRRVQRAAFKQAALLAQDHRHPSLRALPLEGLPGYYRVRVATDVRLLYRRTERQNTIEILSLIDREDLDRYIKQAKTRAG